MQRRQRPRRNSSRRYRLRQQQSANARDAALGGRLPWADRPAPSVLVSLGLAAAVPLAVFLALQPELASALGALVAGFAAGRLSN